MPLYPQPKFRGPKRTKGPVPLSRVELHIHLDGSVRMSTVWELAKQKGLALPGDGSIGALTSHVELDHILYSNECHIEQWVAGAGVHSQVRRASAMDTYQAKFLWPTMKHLPTTRI